MKKPYVVSSDLGLVWQKLAGTTLPADGLQRFRAEGEKALTTVFGACDWIPEQELEYGLADLLSTESLPCISLDPIYAPSSLNLGMTRLVNERGEDVGYGQRSGEPFNLEEAVRDLSQQIDGSEAVIVDDVIFNGSLCVRLIDLFERYGIRIVKTYAGVAMGEGAKRLGNINCEVHSIRYYEDVIDEVCERDFMPGAPLSGRTVWNGQNSGMPYLLPFGNAERWASFPPQETQALSKVFLTGSINLYREMEMKAKMIPRRIHGLRCHDQESIATALERARSFF